jgi:hypothetical protein
VGLYQDGKSIRQIAAELGWSYGKTHRILSQHTTLRPPSHRTKASEPAPCGTKRAYQRHLDASEEPDEACKKANRDYTNAYDRRTGASKARNRAYRRLAARHPEVFEALRAEEQRKVDIEDPTATKNARAGRARERAHRRLVGLHPGDFEALLAEEKQIAREEAGQAAFIANAADSTIADSRSSPTEPLRA